MWNRVFRTRRGKPPSLADGEACPSSVGVRSDIGETTKSAVTRVHEAHDAGRTATVRRSFSRSISSVRCGGSSALDRIRVSGGRRRSTGVVHRPEHRSHPGRSHAARSLLWGYQARGGETVAPFSDEPAVLESAARSRFPRRSPAGVTRRSSCGTGDESSEQPGGSAAEWAGGGGGGFKCTPGVRRFWCGKLSGRKRRCDSGPAPIGDPCDCRPVGNGECADHGAGGGSTGGESGRVLGVCGGPVAADRTRRYGSRMARPSISPRWRRSAMSLMSSRGCVDVRTATSPSSASATSSCSSVYVPTSEPR